MTLAVCLRYIQSMEINAHVFCCPRSATERRLVDFVQRIISGSSATYIERTWKHYLETLLVLPICINLVDSLPVAHGDGVFITASCAGTERDRLGKTASRYGVLNLENPKSSHRL